MAARGPSRNAQAFTLPTIVALSLFMAAMLGFFQVAMAGEAFIAALIASAYFLAIYVAMIATGEIAKWRRVFFVSVAILFVPSFMAMIFESRGSMSVSDLEAFKNEVPFCHIVLPSAILPYLLTGDLIFPAQLKNYFASFYAMLAIWLIATLTVGRGWCSWVCFYGGWDDGFSRASKKARIKVEDPSGKIRYFNFAMLAFVVLASLGTLSAVYCTWLCPFKTVTEFGAPENLASYLAMLAFVLLFFGLAVALPILTRKRTQCMSFCPFGAFQSLADKASPYRVRVDRSKCVDCGACVAACPTLSLSPESVLAGKTLITCTKCGECMRACPKGAIDYAFAWSKSCGDPRSLFDRLRAGVQGSGIISRIARAALTAADEIASPRALMVTSGYLIGCIIGGSFASDSIRRLIHLFTTGSFLLK